MIYEDLVSRDQKRLLTYENLEIFFQMNTLWGKSLYRKFIAVNGTTINEASFVKTVQKCVKADPEEKLKLIFSLYDLNERGGINFNELLAFVHVFLFSYFYLHMNNSKMSLLMIVFWRQ